jgi:hypothetical protein
VQGGGDNPAVIRAIQGLYADALASHPAAHAAPAAAAPALSAVTANPIQDHLQTLIQQVLAAGACNVAAW